MTSEIVQGKAAWARLKKGSKSWDDWKTVGTTLLEGRAIAIRSAGTTSPAGRGYSDAFNEWLTCNRFDIGPSHRPSCSLRWSSCPRSRTGGQRCH